MSLSLSNEIGSNMKRCLSTQLSFWLRLQFRCIRHTFSHIWTNERNEYSAVTYLYIFTHNGE